MKYVFDEVSNILGEPTMFGNFEIPQPKVKNINSFYYGLQCLQIRKNRSENIEILKMTYLEFLLREIEKEKNEDNSKKFLTSSLYHLMLSLFGEVDIAYIINGSSSEITINDKKIKAIEFDDFKKLIFKQNYIQFDENLTQEVEEGVKKVEEYQSKQQNYKSPTFAEMIVSYHVATLTPYKDVKELTIGQFQMGLERFNLLKDFEVYTYAQLKSGKKDIKHWMSHIDREINYSKYFTKTSKTINKIQ